MKLKTVEEYSVEMTREEFDQFTAVEELCPSDFGLNDLGDNCTQQCNGCWDKALTGINFKVAVPGLPKEILPVIQKLQELEIQAKSIKEKQDTLKVNILEAMEKYKLTKWDNEVMTISYIAPTTRSSIDSAKLKKELPDIAAKYTKTSNVKSSIRIKLK